MWKAIGAFLILFSASMEGTRHAHKIREEYEELQKIRYLISLLKSEICYARSSLEEVFASVAEKCEDPYRNWLLRMKNEMRCKKEKRFVKIWQESADVCLVGLMISRKEKENLKEVGARLGNLDLKMQIRSLELYEEKVEESLRQIQKQMYTKMRLYYLMGIMGGILTVVLLI